MQLDSHALYSHSIKSILNRRISFFIYLQEFLEQLAKSPELPWGVYLQIQSQKLLEVSLELLASAYSSDGLYRPVWITVDGLLSTEDTNVNS